MKRLLLATSLIVSMIVLTAAQQIRVSPDSVTAYSQGATSVFLTYGGVANKRPVDDGRADSRLDNVGAGPAVVHSGGVAGFALPALRYFVGAGGTVLAAGPKSLALLSPDENAVAGAGTPVDFTWSEVEGAAYYRIEFQETTGDLLLSAVVLQGAAFYRAPPWLGTNALKGAAGMSEIGWRVTAFDERGKTLAETSPRLLRLAIQKM